MKSEREMLKNLQQRDDIMTKTNKGSAMVIMDVKDYIKEAKRQLSDTSNYQNLNFDPMVLYTEKSKDVINNYKDAEQISSKMANSLLPDKVKTPTFHLLPKICKPSNPGKSAISSHNCHTSRISEFVDHNLQPAVTNLK